MCLYPRLIPNPKYKPNKKNGGHPPPFTDPRVTITPIRCENCIECRKAKARDWQIRLTEDIKTNTTAKFITLTFNQESLQHIRSKIPTLTGYELDNATATWATRHFLERWRKIHKKSLRHWLITELGHQNTEHIHLHGLLWFPTPEDILKLESTWQYGWVWIGKNLEGKIIQYVNPKTINYITKYVYKTDFQHKEFKSIILTSAGIGSNFNKSNKYNQYNNEKTRDWYTNESGHKIALPTYYRNKLYTEEQKEQLWINKLNQQRLYIMGEKIDISKNYDLYFNKLKIARELNRQLGYGTNKKDPERKQRENQLRALKQKTPPAGSNQKGPDIYERARQLREQNSTNETTNTQTTEQNVDN